MSEAKYEISALSPVFRFAHTGYGRSMLDYSDETFSKGASCPFFYYITVGINFSSH
ncbi:hypothetical protein [Coxiella burnetii]|uniref:hypothetical protein n=1 Tax=Coxiella burnetii TaxID=777 RepID=UPI0003F9882B